MKSHLVAAALLLLVAGPASGQLLFDDFNYGASTGNLPAVSSPNWAAVSGIATGPVLYQTSSLSLPGYPSSLTNGAATISSTGTQDVFRLLPAPQAGLIYLSALVNFSATASNASPGQPFLTFGDSTPAALKGKAFARTSAGNLQFGLSNGAPAPTYSATNYSFNTTYLLVLRFNAATGVAALHVLSTVPVSEPAPLLTGGASVADATMQSVVIRQVSGVDGTPTGVIDGIRVSTDWTGSTTPVDLMNFDVK